ncbi:MAG: CbiX/SirB N-terminal domain-containing protein [Vampirovibrionales bacterium]|nr:CbiX/SirB N-terminal domain-containing protein [Vampirovibrionales bacterium]
MPNTLILLAHGSRDPRWCAPFEHIRERAQTQAPHARIKLAFLEMASPSLSQTLEAVLQQNGTAMVQVLPLFMASGGGHLNRDVPEILAEFNRRYPEAELEQLPPIGEHPQVRQAMIDAIAESL